MKKKQLIKPSLPYILGVVIIFASNYYHFDNSEAFDKILSFLSITTGFTITALSIMATSTFSKELYKQEDPNNNSKTLLHNITGSFENSTFTFIGTIVLILLFSYIKPEPKTVSIYMKEITLLNVNYSIKSLLISTIWYFTILSFWRFIELFKMFLKYVIQNAKRL
jgi:hypothetical protein